MSTEPHITPNPEPLTPEEFVRELRALAARMPIPTPAATPVAKRTRLSHVNSLFVEVTVSAIGASDAVQKALGRTDEDVRQEIDLISRWSAGNEELRRMLLAGIEANTIRRQRVGLTALQTYQICQQLARDEGNASLRTHVDAMKRLNKFARSRRKPAPRPPEPEPVAAKTQ